MSGYIGTQPVPQATQTRDNFTATSGQTSFATGGYTPNFLDVYLNGVKLASADYTASNGSDVVLASGAATGDILEVVAFTTFNSASSSIDDNGNATAITIDSNENVMLNTTNTSLQLSSSDEGFTYANNFTTVSRDGGTTAYFNRLSSDGDVVAFRKNGSTVGSIGTTGGDVTIDGGSEHTGLRFESTQITPRHNSAYSNNWTGLGTASNRFKDLYLGDGIYLGGTGSANKLEDYEEGTFTPTVVFGSGSSGITYSVRQGKYTKIGNTVQFYVQCSLSNKGSSTGNLSITGLPFTNNDTGSPHSILTGAFNNTNDVQLYLNTGSATINLENRNTGSQSPLTHSNVNNNSTIFISGVYRTTQ